jgi:hypothetical protein
MTLARTLSLLPQSNTTNGFAGSFAKANSANYYAYLVDSNTTAAFAKANTAAANGSNTCVGQCRLVKNGSNLELQRFDGRLLFINGTQETVPNTAPSLSTSGLSSSTLYYIYAFMNSGTMTLSASTTTPVRDNTYGNRIKSGDSSNVLVGMARTNGSTAFVDSVSQRFTRSWFNEPPLTIQGAGTGGASTTSTGGWVELSSSCRAEFISWSGESVFCSGLGFSRQDTGYDAYSGVGLDGVATILQALSYHTGATAVNYGGVSAGGIYDGLSAGYHYLTPAGFVSGSTGYFFMYLNGVILGKPIGY